MSLLHTDLWLSEIAKTLRARSAFGSLGELEPDDFWNGEVPGTYSEAVAWARLLGVSVAKRGGATVTEFVMRSGAKTPLCIPLCCPEELIQHIRSYASKQ